ncbi:MAG: hypothetical protein WAU45_04320 [Blastocatellia bacterium]
MMLKAIATFALLLSIGGFGIAAAINQFAIIDAVNAKLPRGEQFERLGWYFTKTLSLHRKYRRFYPDGRLVLRGGILGTTMLVCLALAASLIGFDFLGIAWVGGIGALSLWFVYFRKSSPS